jgi:hypothetical protein
VKFTPEDLQKIETKKLANIIRKLNAGGTLTAREDRILAEAKLSGGEPLQTSAAANFVSTWDELAKNIGVTRRTLQTWRIDEKLGPQCPPTRAGGQHDVTAWLEFMVRFGLKRADEQFHPDDLPDDDRRSTRDWKNEREKLMCVRLQRDIDRDDGKLLVADELEIPVGATWLAFQNRYSQFPERAAGRCTGFDDSYEVEARMREIVDADLRDLNAARYLDESLSDILNTLPVDEETERLIDLVTFAGQDRANLMLLIERVARAALQRIGRCAIAQTRSPDSGPENTSGATAQPETAAVPADPIAAPCASAKPQSKPRRKAKRVTRRRKA